MNLYLCDTCNTLATVEATGVGIKLAPCACIAEDDSGDFICPVCKELKPFLAGSGDCQTCDTCCKCPDDAYDTGKYCYPY